MSKPSNLIYIYIQLREKKEEKNNIKCLGEV